MEQKGEDFQPFSLKGHLIYIEIGMVLWVMNAVYEVTISNAGSTDADVCIGVYETNHLHSYIDVRSQRITNYNGVSCFRERDVH